MLSSVLGGGVRREHTEEVVGARRGAEQQEEPSRLQVGEGRDALQQGVVLAALLLQVLSHESCGSEGGAKNDQSLAFRQRAPRPYPNIAALLGLDGGEIGGLLSRSVPDAGLALVELDSGASPQGVAEGRAPPRSLGVRLAGRTATVLLEQGKPRQGRGLALPG